jgi:ABC-2 type transport system permease protein
MLVLCAHSLRRMRPILIGLGLLLAAFQFLLVQIGAYLVRHSAFGGLSLLIPDFVRTIAGPSALAFMSFTGVVALGYFHPVVIAAALAVTLTIGSEAAAEVEMRFVDLTLARDVTRTAMIVRTWIVFLVATGWIVGLMALGSRVGLACCAPAEVAAPGLTLLGSLAASLASVMVCWCGITTAVAAAVKRRAVAGAAAGIAALSAFLLDYVGRAWEPAAALGRASPFHYFEPTALIMGTPLNLTNVAVLVGIGALGGAIGWLIFTHRDI